ncbi:TPA: hypothetical protein ACH3X3_002520 [Trebouxia sp. C0006]
MVCYNLYIFNREGTCLFYQEWSRPKSVKQGAGTPLDDQKMMFGLFFSLKTFAAAMDPRISETKPQLGAPLNIGNSCSFKSFRTNNYKLHFMESPSGLKIVFNTDQTVGNLQDCLTYIYSNLYVEYVMKNPLYEPGQPFSYELFSNNLNRYIRSIGL